MDSYAKIIFGYKNLKDPAKSSLYIFNQGVALAYGKRQQKPDALSQMRFWYLIETGFTGPRTIADLGQSVQSTVMAANANKELLSVKNVDDKDVRGIEVIFEQPEPWQSRLTFDIDSHEPFLSMTDGAGTAQKRLETERRKLAGKVRVIRLRLNSERGWAVEEKWEYRKETGQLMFHTKNSEFVQVGRGGVWMPMRCVVASHAYETSPLTITPEALYETVIQIKVVRHPEEFEYEQCRMWYNSPGVTVTDHTSPKATLEDADVYQVPVAVDKLPKASSGVGRRVWLIVLNLLCIAGLARWLYSRSRK